MLFAGLILEPGQDLVGHVGIVQPGVLISQQQLPKEADTDQQQQGGSSR